MDYAKLKAELALPAYATAKGDDAAAMLNARTLAGPPRMLTNKEYLNALSQGSIAKAEEAAQDKTAKGYEAAVTVGEYVYAVGSVDVTAGSPCRAALDVMVAQGVITQAELGALIAQAATFLTRAEQLGIQPPTPTDVGMARGTIPMVQTEVTRG